MPEKSLGLAAVKHHILRRQHLAGSTAPASLVQVARDIGGLHATGPKTPYLSLFSRVPGFTRERLDEEMYRHKSLVRIRCMRNTLHILPRTTVPVAFAATRRFTGLNAERFCRHRGVDEEEYARASLLMIDLIKDGGRTTAELKGVLGPATSLTAVLTLMCDRAILVRGETPNWRSNAYTYQLLSEYFPGLKLDHMEEREAIGRLIQFYLSAFGPVTVDDITWWTGLGKKATADALDALPVAYCAISGLDGEFALLRREAKRLAGIRAGPGRTINFLPGMDPFIMGYKLRDRYLERDHYFYVFDRSGNAAPTILVDGRVAGIWDFSEDNGPVVMFHLFDRAQYQLLLPEICRKASAIGSFIAGTPVRLKECRSMIPLTKRKAGGVMSPLKGQ
jgi:hypothetical protein